MRAWPLILALAVTIASAGAVVYWGGQDKQGRFQPDLLRANGGMSLFFAGPYALLATAAIAARRRRRLSIATLTATTLLAAMGVLAVWTDHRAYLRTPPGRETTPMLGFLATLVLWLASIVTLCVAAAVARGTLRAPSK